MLLNRTAAAATATIALIAGMVAAPMSSSAATRDDERLARIAVVFPLSAPAGAEGLIDSETLAEYTSPGGFLTRELDAIEDTDVTIGIDPLLIASIRILGRDAPASALEWLNRLEGVTNETFSLTYADSDVTLALQAGSREVLAPTSFEFAINPERFGEPAAETPSPTADPEADSEPDSEPAGPPPLPSSATLLNWTHDIPSIAWPRPMSLAKADLAAIAESGFTTTLLDSQSVARDDNSTALALIGKRSVIVSDTDASSLFSKTISSVTTDDWRVSLRALSRSFTERGSSAVIAVPRADVGNHTRLRETLVALDNLKRAVTVGLSSVLSDEATSGTFAYNPYSAPIVRQAKAALAAERETARFATVAENPLLITGERRLRLLAALSTQWVRSDEGAQGQLRDFRAECEEIRQSVTVAESSDLLFGDRGFIPINISNSLNQPVTVIVTIRPLTPVLKVEDENFEVQIEPDSQRRAQIPAAALSNGVVSLSVTMRTESGVPLGSPHFVRANVQAGWETPLTTGLGILVFAVLVVGIIRSIRKRRKVNAELRAENAATVEAVE